MAAGRFDEAAAYCLSLPSDFPARNEWLGRARLGQGRIQETIHLFEKPFSGGIDYQSSTAPGFLGYAYGRAGRREDAENLAAKTSEAYNQALISLESGTRNARSGRWNVWRCSDRCALRFPQNDDHRFNR